VEPGHLLVEIGAEPPKLLLVAQLAGLNYLIEPGREGLVFSLGSEIPVTAAGRRRYAVAKIITRPGLILAGFHLFARITLRVLVLDLFPAHLDVAAAGRAFIPLLGRVLATAFFPSASSPASSGWSSIGSSADARSILEEPARQLGKGGLVIESQG
jgi:hypothetical protein